MANQNPNVGLTRPRSAAVAPPYSDRFSLRRRVPIRLPSHASLAAVPEGILFFIPIFDTASLFQGAQSAGSGGQLGASQSYQNDFEMTEDFWWIETMAGPAASLNSFVFQLYSNFQDGDSTQYPATWQKTPITGGNLFGSAQKPCILERPQLIPAGTQLSCNVQNLTTNPLTLQLVLMGYLAARQAGG